MNQKARSRRNGAPAPRQRRRQRSARKTATSLGKITVAPTRTFKSSEYEGLNFRFTAAPPHDEFPVGGLRLVGEIPNTYNDGIYDSGSTSGYTSSFDGSAAACSPLIGVSPTAYSITTLSTPINMFGNANNVISTFAAFFRRFRFRKLELVYESSVGSSTSVSVQFAYDRDFTAAYALAGLSNSQRQQAGQIALRCAAWTPEPEIVCLIEEKAATRADELYICGSADDGITVATTADATLQQRFQGAVMGTMGGSHITTGVTTLGYYRWRFVLDLYGFSPQPGPSLAFVQKKAMAEEKLLHERKLEDKSSRGNGALGNERLIADEKGDRKSGEESGAWISLDRNQATPPPTPVQLTRPVDHRMVQIDSSAFKPRQSASLK